jgi:hypothetical protein
VHDVLISMPSLEAVMVSFDNSLLPASLAVIGDELFDALDLRVLPPSYASIPAFKEGPFTIPEFTGLASEEEVVRYVCDHVTADNQDDVAIVVDKGSSYHSSILSLLRQRGITVNLSVQLNEDLKVRTVHGLVDAALDYPRLRVRDVRPFFGLFGIDVPIKYDNYHVDALPRPLSEGYAQLLEALKAIPTMTYGDVVRLVVTHAGALPEELHDTIRALGYYDKPVNDRTFEELSYCLMNFDITLGRTSHGVVLTSAHNSTYVDRPVCIFVGLDNTWRRRLPPLPIQDAHAVEKTHVREFQILLSQGERRRAVVALRKNGEPVMPCQYLSMALETPLDDFFNPALRIKRTSAPITTIEREQAIFTPERVEWDGKFSQSSLNRFIECPKRFEYARLVSTARGAAMVKGTLLHEYAELYLSHPEAVNEHSDQAVAAIMAEEYGKLVSDEHATLAVSTFLLGMRMMRSYIESLDLGERPLFEKRPKGNRLAKRLGIDASTPYGEVLFSSPTYPVMGYIDLLTNNEHIIDYKTGRRTRSTTSIMRELHPWLQEDKVDVQPVLYLLALEEMVPDVPLTFTFFYPYADMERAIEEGIPSEKNCIAITYIPTSFHDFLLDDRCYDLLCDTKTNQTFAEKLGWKTVQDYFADHPPTLEDQFLAPMEQCAWVEGFAAHVERLTDKKTLIRQARPFAKSVIRKRRGNGKQVMLFKEDLEMFATLVDECHQRVGEHMATEFIARPLDSSICDRCEFADHCIGRFW